MPWGRKGQLSSLQDLRSLQHLLLHPPGNPPQSVCEKKANISVNGNDGHSHRHKKRKRETVQITHSKKKRIDPSEMDRTFLADSVKRQRKVYRLQEELQINEHGQQTGRKSVSSGESEHWVITRECGGGVGLRWKHMNWEGMSTPPPFC